MTAILTISPSKSFARNARLLLVGASGLALSAPLAANQVLFTTSEAQPATGQRTDQRSGLTQIALTGGGTASIVDAAEYRLNADGSIDLYEGTITVASGATGGVVVRMPEGLEGRVAGTGAAGNFTVRETGEASGHALTGAVQIGRANAFERFAAGEMWRVRGQGGVRRVVANGAVAQPAELAVTSPAQPGRVVPIGSDAGPVAAALNGIPAGLGDQLASAGASSDIIAAARRIEAVAGNPALDTFPSGDLALLVAAAARIESSYGGTPFPQAQADIIRAYLRFLAGGGARSDFLSAYSGFVSSYLDLIRAGGMPSGFAGTGPADVEAYLAYLGRTGALADLAARDRVLAEAYLAFLASGGSRDAFALSFTDLTAAYFAFVRGGGDPAAFTGASQAMLAQTIAFLRDSGLLVRLSPADRALVDAFLSNGGLAFAAQYETALGDYFAFLASGRRPSEYAAIDQATLRAYLETLANTGLLSSVLGERAAFYADYLAFLRAGGEIDGFAGLPTNVFAGYAAQLNVYFAFLSTGGRPSDFKDADIAVLQAWLLQLQTAGALDRFLGDRAAFFAQYAAFVAGGGSVDSFAGLPANIFAAYAVDLRAYFAFLTAGGLPSNYTLLTPDQIRAYIAALEAAGATSAFLGDIAAFYREYAVYLATGANPDLFAGLPVQPDLPAFAAALNAYALFLQGGGLPSNYSADDLAQLQGFIDAVIRSGQLAGLLGDNADLLTRYFAFLSAGGNPDGFAGLPVYSQYVAALNAYYQFLLTGGLPSGYSVLDPATVEAYLAALAALQGGLGAIANLDPFFVDYFVFIAGGGNPDQFAGLPVNGGGGNPDGVSTKLAGINAWVLGADGLRTNTAADVAVDQEGRISSVTLNAAAGNQTFTFDPASDALREFGRIGDAVAWSRYLVGRVGAQTNVSQNVLIGTPATNLPGSGTVSYRLVGGTAPSNRSGALGSMAYFTGNLAVAFGSVPLVGLDFDVLSGTEGYRASTPGGAANPVQGLAIRADGTFEDQALALTALTATSCNAFCQAQVFGGAFGDGGEAIGFTYNIFDQAAGNSLQGIAVFGQSGTALPSLGTPPDPIGGGDGGTPTLGTVADFDTSVLVTAALSYGEEGFTRTSRTGDTDISATGVLNRIGSFSRGTATGDQIIGDQYAIIGRWIDGTSNLVGRTYTSTAKDAVHWAIASLPNRDFTLSGQISYDLLGATTPTYSDGRTAPGTFDGSLVINWQSPTQIALNLAAEVTMPDAVYAWSFQSPNFATRLQGVFESNATVNGAPCSNNNCQAAVSYQFGGARVGERFAMNYNISLFDQNLDIGGAALFGAPGTYDPAAFAGSMGGGSGGSGGGGSGGAVAIDGVVPSGAANSPFAYVGSGTSGEVVSAATMTVTNGVLLAARRGSVSVAYTPGSNSTIEVSGDQGVIGWQRINSVSTAYSGGTGQGFQASAFPEQYWHTVWGAPLVNLPTMGLVNYEFIGGSTAHQTNARPGDGTFQGRFAVDFATLRAGLEATVTLTGADAGIFDFASDGGVAAPSIRLFDDGFGTRRFIETLPTTERGVGSVSRGTNVTGFLAGDGASHAGITYRIRRSSSNAVVGTAAFRAVGAASPGAAGTTAARMMGAQGPAPIPATASTPALPGADWGRWAGTATTGAQRAASAETDAANGMVPAGLAGTAGEPVRADHRAAIRQAEQLMGGMITFGHGNVEQR